MRLRKATSEPSEARAHLEPYGVAPQSEPNTASSAQRGRAIGKRVGKFVGGIIMLALEAVGWGHS